MRLKDEVKEMILNKYRFNDVRQIGGIDAKEEYPILINDMAYKVDELELAKEKFDAVNSPPHYTRGGIELINVMRAKMGDDFEGYVWGNVIKYIFRYKHKNGVEDLKKAHWYLTELIKLHGGEQNVDN